MQKEIDRILFLSILFDPVILSKFFLLKPLACGNATG